MTCPDVRERLSALADDVLTPADRATCQAHLATCPECAREWDRFRATLGLLHRVAPMRAPAGFVDRVQTAARPAPAWRRLVRWIFVPWPVKLPLEAAAGVLVALLAIVVVQRTPELTRAAREERAVPQVSEAPRPMPTKESVSRPAEERRATPSEPRAPSPLPPPSTSAEVPATIAQAEPVSPGQHASEAFGESQRSVPASPPRVPDSGTRRLERAEQRAVQPQPAEPRRERSMLSSVSTAPLVSGDLVVADRDTAARALVDLVARVGGVERGRRVVGDILVMEIELAAPETYPTFAEELGAIGAWRPDRGPDVPTGRLRVVLRVTARAR